MQSNGNFEKFRKSPDVGKKDRRMSSFFILKIKNSVANFKTNSEGQV